MLIPNHLRCESLTTPLSIITNAPRLSWIPESSERAQKQTAYQVVASSSAAHLSAGHFDLWDSGTIESDATLNIIYAGKALSLGDRCWWMVRLWDASGKVSGWSEPSYFGRGATDSEWKGQWIGDNRARDIELPPAPFEGAQWIWSDDNKTKSETSKAHTFFGTIHLPLNAEVEHAELAVTADERYQLFSGGQKLAWSDDDAHSWKRPMIRDVTERLQAGPNHFIIQAAHNGAGAAGLLFKLTVQLVDGSTHQLISDANWQVTEKRIETYPTDVESLNLRPCHVVDAYEDAAWGEIRGINCFLPRVSYLRTEFNIPKTVQQATLYAAALGWHDLHLNGTRVADIYFESGATDYKQRVYYRGFDVTKTLKPGINAWGVALGDGWYSGCTGWFHQRDLYGKHPRFSGQLHVQYTDGSFETFISDQTWQASAGPSTSADILMGESYDAREELIAWTEPGYDASQWTPVDTGAEVQPLIQPHPSVPVMALRDEAFKPASIQQVEPGIWICDMGQNFAGFALIKVSEAKGTKIRLRFAERLKDNGRLYRTNLRSARATDEYICKGDGVEIWEPRFTFHGFQYIEISGLTHAPDLESVTGIPVSSHTPLAGTFDCSDSMANKLASNVYWSQRSNFIDIPTDCPQRDERMGWTFDAQIFLPSAVLRADVQTFFEKWMIDLEDARDPSGFFTWVAPRVLPSEECDTFWNSCSPGWTDAGVICPWIIYETYENRRQLEAHYPNMKLLVEWYRQTSRPNLLHQKNTPA